MASDLKLIAQGPLISSDDIKGLNQAQAQSAAYEMKLEEAEKKNELLSVGDETSSFKCRMRGCYVGCPACGFRAKFDAEGKIH